MSRSGYTEDYYSEWDMIRWRGAVASAMRGKRGQAFLRETLKALDELPEQKLIQNELSAKGEFCTLGAVGHSRNIDMSKLDPDDHNTIANVFDISHALACEIMYMNDEVFYLKETPEARWERMRKWIIENIKGE